MTSVRMLHVSTSMSGGWCIHRRGARHAIIRFSTRALAVRIARQLAWASGDPLSVHRKDGTVLRIERRR